MKVSKSYLKQLIKEELQIAEQAANVALGQTGGLPQEIITALTGPMFWNVLETLKTQIYAKLGTKVGQFFIDNATDILDLAVSAVQEQAAAPLKPLPNGRIRLANNPAALKAFRTAAAVGLQRVNEK